MTKKKIPQSTDFFSCINLLRLEIIQFKKFELDNFINIEIYENYKLSFQTYTLPLPKKSLFNFLPKRCINVIETVSEKTTEV